MGNREHVAAREKLTKRRRSLDPLVHDLVEEAGGEPEGRDPVPREEGPQLVHREDAGRSDREPATVQERAPDLEGRGIERERSELQDASSGPKFA